MTSSASTPRPPRWAKSCTCSGAVGLGVGLAMALVVPVASADSDAVSDADPGVGARAAAHSAGPSPGPGRRSTIRLRPGADTDAAARSTPVKPSRVGGAGGPRSGDAGSQSAGSNPAQRRALPSAATGSHSEPAAAVAKVVAQAASADPIGALTSGLAAVFNNQTPRLRPTQTTQSANGVVSGHLNATDPDSPLLGYAITGPPANGTAMLSTDGGWTYIPDPAPAVTGLTDSFRVTVTDAPSGFAIHGLAGLLHLLSFGLVGTRGDSSTATVVVTVAGSDPGADPDPDLPAARDYILIRQDDLMAKPTSGAGWDFLKQQADSGWETPDLAAPNTKNPGRVLAAALVYARTGDLSYRNKVIAAIRQLPGTEAGADIVLPFARNLFGYVMAADLVDMPLDTATTNGQTWQEFLRGSRELEFPGHTRWLTLTKTAGDSAGNWNAYALSTHLAVSIVLDDQAAIERDISIFRRFLGDTTSPWPAFRPTSGHVWNDNGRTWDLTPTLQRGINPAVPGDRRSGAIIVDVSRHTTLPSIPCCAVDLAGRAYTEESLDALLAIATVLKAHGHDFTDFEDQALRRAYEFLLANGGPSGYSNGRYLAPAINAWYGTAYDTSQGDSIARHLGFGTWLF